MAKRTPDESIIVALLEHHGNVTAAAVAIGLTRRTIQIRMKDGVFLSKYHAARDRMIDQCCHVLQANAAAAGQYLVDLMNDPTAPPTVRMNAAVTIIDKAVKMTELCSVLPRLERLEADGGIKADD